MTGETPVNMRYLVWHWSAAYSINMRRGKYIAVRRDDNTVLTAKSAEDLLHAIRADYQQRPVPRH